MSVQRNLLCGALLLACGLLGGCGGGSSSSTSISTASAPLPPSLASVLDSNVALVEVRQGPGSNVNIPYVTVTVCQSGGSQGSSRCAAIKDVMVDTGSTGLRLFASQVNALLALPDQTVGSSAAIFECGNFIASSAWGRIKLADVLVGGERANSVPIQLMEATDAGALKCNGAPLLSTTTTAAKTIGSVRTKGTVALSANGILGVGLFGNDGQAYASCTALGTSCSDIDLRNNHAKQVQNPVTLFATNNNGVVLQLPSLQPTGIASSAQGYLIFGVNTQHNNQLGAANVVPVNTLGRFTTFYRGVALNDSFIDSGSNGLFFPGAGAPAQLSSCVGNNADFFCPSANAVLPLSASIQLANGLVSTSFAVANADALFPTGGYALANLGGNMPGTAFDWGLPFFYGRSVFTAIEGSSNNAPTGSLTLPFVAFTN